MTYKTSSTLRDGLKSEVTFEGGQRLTVDEPEMLPGGTNAGVNPLDLFLASIGSCQEITYKAYAAAMNIPLEKVAVAMHGDVDLAGFLMVNPDAKRGFSAIRGTVTVTAPNATQEQLHQLKVAVDAHCPMSDTLAACVPLALGLEHTHHKVGLEHAPTRADADADADPLADGHAHVDTDAAAPEGKGKCKSRGSNDGQGNGSGGSGGNDDGDNPNPLSAEAIGALQAAIKADPSLGQLEYSSAGELTAGLQSRVTFPGSGHAMVMDEPESFPGGCNAGPNPLEVALASLGSCQEIAYKAFGAAMRIPINSVSCTVSGECDLRGLLGVDDSVQKGFSAVNASVCIDSPATPEQIKQLKAAVDAHCPMAETLTNPVPMQLVLVTSVNPESRP